MSTFIIQLSNHFSNKLFIVAMGPKIVRLYTGITRTYRLCALSSVRRKYNSHWIKRRHCQVTSWTLFSVFFAVMQNRSARIIFFCNRFLLGRLLKTLMKGYVKKDWWKIIIKDYLDITIAFDFYWFLIVAKESVKWVLFCFFQIWVTFLDKF